MIDWLSDPVVQGLALIGAMCGGVGTFAVLRRQSLLGDTLAHAALPGVCLAFLFTGEKDLPALLLGATATGLIGTLVVMTVVRTSRLKQDVALGIVLSTFFGLGLVLLRYLQDQPEASQAGLRDFIFGKAAFLQHDGVRLMAWCALGVFAVLLLFYKEFKLLSFDPEYCQTLGFRRTLVELLLAGLVVGVVIVSLRAVGVVLTVGLLVAPAAAARQWTHRLGVMMTLSVIFGVFSGVSGGTVSGIPTGPAVVLVASALVLVSLLCAPQRGLIVSWLRQHRHRGKVRTENLLADLYRLGERRGDWGRSWSAGDIAAVRGGGTAAASRTLELLQRRGLVETHAGNWQLTAPGLEEAARLVRMHRLWELYLTRRLELASDHVHRDAEAMEHVLTPDLVAELEQTLENPERDPHGLPIPRAVQTK